MSDSLVFVLHGAADEKAASELAATLSPLPAFPARLPEGGGQGVRFGMGAACVVLWTPQISSCARDVLSAVSAAPGNVVVLRRGGAAAPAEFVDAGFVILESAGDAAAEAAAVNAAVAAIAQASAEHRPGRLQGGPTGRSDAPAQAVGGASSRARKLAIRSAVGLAATMAIASVVAPIVSPRAAVSGDVGDGDGRADSAVPALGPSEAAASQTQQTASEPEALASALSLAVEDERIETLRPAEIARAPVADPVTPVVAEQPPAETPEQAQATTVDPELAERKARPAADSESARAKGEKKGNSVSEQSEASA